MHEIDTSNHDATFETKEIVWDSLPFADIELEIHEDSGYSVHAADTYIIPPNTECVIPATFKDCHLTETLGMIEPIQTYLDALMFAVLQHLCQYLHLVLFLFD
jgi:hypothetical protein